MTLPPERRRDALTEMDANSRRPIGPERQPVVDERPSRAGGRPPPVVAGDMSVIDVAERGLHPEEPVGCSECPLVGDGDAVLARTNTEGEPERRKPSIHGVGKELGHDI